MRKYVTIWNPLDFQLIYLPDNLICLNTNFFYVNKSDCDLSNGFLKLSIRELSAIKPNCTKS